MLFAMAYRMLVGWIAMWLTGLHNLCECLGPFHFCLSFTFFESLRLSVFSRQRHRHSAVVVLYKSIATLTCSYIFEAVSFQRTDNYKSDFNEAKISRVLSNEDLKCTPQHHKHTHIHTYSTQSIRNWSATDTARAFSKLTLSNLLDCSFHFIFN